jgi:Lrp/AsnC family transcriptional regulator, regulator for asnA, asnC and gidA
MQSFEIDDLDRKIIHQYVSDSRQSFHQVARKVGISPSTVIDRTKRLEKSGIIRGYTAVLDYEKLGLTVTAITELTTTGGKLADVEKKLALMPEANSVYDVAGATDAIVLSKFRSTSELSRFTKRMQAIPNVSKTETHIVLTVVKEGLPKF